MILSKLGYSELVQRLFEKMTFFLVDPLLLRRHLLCQIAALPLLSCHCCAATSIAAQPPPLLSLRDHNKDDDDCC